MYRQIMATAVLLTLSGCGGGDKAASPPAETGAADIARDTAGAVLGGVTGVGVSTGDLPDFVEVPRGAKAIHNMRVNNDGKTGGSLSLTTPQKAPELIAFYRASMERQGLAIGLENQSAQMTQLMGESADKSKSLMVMILTDDEGVSQLNLTHSRKVES